MQQFFLFFAFLIAEMIKKRVKQAIAGAAGAIDNALLAQLQPLWCAQIQAIDVLMVVFILGQVMIQVQENINLKCLRLSDWTLSGMG